MYSIFFGSSSVSMFSLVKNQKFIIRKFKGASMMGLLKEDNKNRQQIIKIIKKYENKISKLVFCFGEVDLHFGYYFNLINKGIDMDIDEKRNFKNISKDYLEFINSLDCGTGCQKVVIGPFPNCELGIDQVIKKQKIYNVIDKDINESSLKPKIREKLKYQYQKKRFLEFHSWLQKYCLQYKIKFVDTQKICLHKNSDVKECLVHKYNKLNIHLNWEPMIQEIINSCGFKFINFEREHLEKLQNSFYSKRKKRNSERRLKNRKTIKKKNLA